MKTCNLIFPAVALLAATATSCSQEPIVEINPVVEEYTQNFIKQFGIPAPGHSYATAVRAGLKVATKTGCRVLVTAEVDGKEYRFANLNVPAGTHEVPVTIPAGVERLKVKNGMVEQEVGINDMVDLDALGATPDSRGWNVNIPADTYILGFEDDDEAAPLLSFKPSDFLKSYFEAHPIGEESTNYTYMGDNVGNGAINPYLSDDINVWYGETALGSTVEEYIYDDAGMAVDYKLINTEYYIFPVWWRTNRYNAKDYQLFLHQYNKMVNTHRVPFNESNDSRIPFPRLGYSDEEIEMEDVLNSMSKFHYDTGDFTQAYDPNSAKTIITEGMKVKFPLPPNPGWDLCGIGFYLTSTRPDGTLSWSCTQPYWNMKVWGNKYFDQSISHLMYSTVSTMRFQLPEMVFNNLNFKIYEKEDRLSGYNERPFLVGFTSGPEKEADTTPRDYTDFIMLVIPVNGVELLYNVDDLPDPYIWTLAAEDLGATDDWDFNDVVLHITDEIVDLNSSNRNSMVTYYNGPAVANGVRILTVEPVATGGTLPIYVTFTGNVRDVMDIPDWGDDMFSEVNAEIGKTLSETYENGTFILGTEVHKWLNADSYTTFVNVGSKRQPTNAKKITFAVDPDQDMFVGNGLMNWDLGVGSHGSPDNCPLYGFALIVDRENKLQIDTRESGGFVHMPKIEIGKNLYPIGCPNENSTIAPQLLFMGGDWEWPTERTKISDAYPQFNTWLTMPSSAPLWHYSSTDGKVTKK